MIVYHSISFFYFYNNKEEDSVGVCRLLFVFNYKTQPPRHIYPPLSLSYIGIIVIQSNW